MIAAELTAALAAVPADSPLAWAIAGDSERLLAHAVYWAACPGGGTYDVAEQAACCRRLAEEAGRITDGASAADVAAEPGSAIGEGLAYFAPAPGKGGAR
jgi:hypothetical protein